MQSASLYDDPTGAGLCNSPPVPVITQRSVNNVTALPDISVLGSSFESLSLAPVEATSAPLVFSQIGDAALCTSSGVAEQASSPHTLEITSTATGANTPTGGPSATPSLWTHERLTSVDPRRFVLFPISYTELWRAYQQRMGGFWVAEEHDPVHAISPKTKQDVLRIALLILETNQGVHYPLLSRLSVYITAPEVRCFFGFQVMTENVHMEAISKATTVFTASASDLLPDTRFFIQELNAPKEAWINQVLLKYHSCLGEQVFVLAIIQCLFCTTSLWLLRTETHDGLAAVTSVLRQICEDRESHVEYACLLYYHLQNRPSVAHVGEIVRAAVNHEVYFGKVVLKHLSDSTTYPLESLQHSIETNADQLLQTLGLPGIYSSIRHASSVEKAESFAHARGNFYSPLTTHSFTSGSTDALTATHFTGNDVNF